MSCNVSNLAIVHRRLPDPGSWCLTDPSAISHPGWQDREFLHINLGGDASIDPTSDDKAQKTLRLRQDQASSPLRDLLTPDQRYNPEGKP